MVTWETLGCCGLLLLVFIVEPFLELLWGDEHDPEDQQSDHAAREKEFQAASERLMKAEMEEPPL